MSYTDILRQMKGDHEQKKFGALVSKIKKTSEELLFELEKLAKRLRYFALL